MGKNTTVHVTARLRSRPDTTDTLRHELTALTGPTRSEPGCLRYELYEHGDSPGEFLFIEQWQTATDLERHLRQPHIQTFIKKSGALLAEPMRITQWRRVG